MSRRHYERLAAALRGCRPAAYTEPGERRAWNAAVRAIAEALRGTNEAYDEDRFLAACGAKLTLTF